ncbi:MAG: methylmalonyl Co-A mutase-associated GTPase MeaB [Bacteroidia bacterium]
MAGQYTMGEYEKGILAGNISVLSRAITLVESTREEHQAMAHELIDKLIGRSGNSVRIGITGVPGVGKSTFIESFGLHLAKQGHKIAVLAVDPSSQLSKGSILGDKTRMEELAVHPNVFIRPSPSAGSLGGVGQKTKETIILCEAAGFNQILIETVGVGQSETAVHQLSDFFLLLMLAGAGDELQGIKRGIMEMADAIVITKADGNNVEKAKSARAEYARAIHLFPPSDSGWIPEVLTCSSLEGSGITEIDEMMLKYFRMARTTGYFEKKRKEQSRFWLHQLIDEKLKERFYSRPGIASAISELEILISESKISPYAAINSLFP